jgi:hypothetical protein
MDFFLSEVDAEVMAIQRATRLIAECEVNSDHVLGVQDYAA